VQISRVPMDVAPSPKFGLSLLGGFELTGPDGVVDLPSKKLAGLLAYLACNAPRPQSREKLSTLLWGSHFDAQAKQNLRQALFRLRKVLGQDALESDSEAISLNSDVVLCDVYRFETLIREGSREALSSAADLYRGRLIDDVTVGEEGWNEWLTGERERLLELALGAIVGLGDRELAAGRAAHALKAGQRAISLNNMREDAHRLIVRALAAIGRKAEALTHYQHLVALLKQELNTEPDAATRSLAAELRGTSSSGRSPAVREIAKPALPQHDQASAALPPLDHTRGDHEQKVNTNNPGAWSDTVSSMVAVRAGALERRQLTILVCKMVGSTTLSTHDPEDMRDVVAAFHKVIADGVARFDGFVAQYQSDGAVVYFGYPEAHEYEAEHAVRAGLAILADVGSLKISSGIPLQARAGIATGVVVFGEQMGGAHVLPAVAIGETPYLAAQMQAVASPGEVVIAGSTRRLVGRLFDYRALGAHEVKGLPQAVEAWQVRGEAASVSRFEARRVGALSPLVGRQEEMDLLRRRWNQAELGEGRVVLLSGEPGIGKSRIAESLLGALEGEPHARMRFFCSPHHTNSPLYPFIAQLERAAGFEPGNSAAAKLDKLEALLKNAPRDLALIADLLSVSTDGRCPVLEVSSAQQKREMTLSALLHRLEGMAAQSPVLIVFEDAHWIDPTSLDLLDRAVDCIAKLPVLMVVTVRPEFQPVWVGQPHVTVLPLSRLGRRDSAGIIGGVAQGKTLPDVVVQQILAHTDGVPLFIEELTSTLLESGHLRDTADGGYVLDGPLPSLAIPTTLQASLLARLDRLAPVKDIAQIGAVIGREFSFGLIAAVSAMAKQELEAALGKLVAAELIFQRGVPPGADYRFKHALVQDAAYASLLRSRRSALHAAVVKELVAVGVSDTEVKPELLAHHCAEAGMAEEAVRHYLKASEQAVARSALTEAAAMLDKALGKVAQLPTGLPRDRMELEVQSARGPILIAVNGFAAAETGQAYARARDLWDRLGRPPEFLLRTARVRWSLHTNRSQFFEAQSVVDDLLEFGRAHGDTVGLILGYFTGGLTHSYRGELQSARASLEEVIRRNDLAARPQLLRYAGTDPQAIASAAIGQVLLFLGYPDQALMRAESAITQARQLAHAPTVAQCLAFGAARASTLGDEARLAHCVQELRALTQEHGYAQWSALVPTFEGQLRLMRGEVGAAVTLMRQGLDARRATGVTLLNATFAIPLGEALGKDGKSGEALALLNEQIVFVEETGELWCAAGLHRLRGQLLLNATVPDSAGAQAEFLKAIDIARGQSAKLWELRAAVSLARLWRNQGRHAEARDLLAPVYGWFTEGLDVSDLKNAKALLDELS
jgi:class 3 adenylate cyclase/DNA-binding SARP family transcriptional activator